MSCITLIRKQLKLAYVILAAHLVIVNSSSAKVERALRVEGSIATDGTSVTLQWWQEEPDGPGNVTISRRLLGQTGSDTWQFLADVSAGTSVYTDSSTAPGTAYEYQILRPYTPISGGDNLEGAGGYWATGVEVPVVENRGITLLVVDETMAPGLDAELKRLQSDLRGDGWEVTMHLVPRHGSYTDGQALALKEWIKAEVAKNPSTQHALLLIGRVPIVKSGADNPDGHNLVAHPTDLFYADIDGHWIDDNYRSGNVPGDGIYDHTFIPSTSPTAYYWIHDGTNRIELWVGRVDFSTMTADPRDEVTMLRDYLNKDHAYRQVTFPHPIRAYWEKMAFDVSETERFGVLNISGPENTTQGVHEGTGQEEPALWGVDFGHADGSLYPDYNIQAIFTINFGSHKQEWTLYNNPMRAIIAQRWYVLTCGWGVRPNWYIHHMALGNPIGYSHFRTVNNGYIPAASVPEYTVVDDYGNQYANAVWISLMGDPTIRAFIPEPPTDFYAIQNGGSVELSWVPSPADGITGYRLYRADTPSSPFIALNSNELITSTSYTDTDPTSEAIYMVRAQRLENVHAGSFYNLSQAAFAKAGNTPPVPGNPLLVLRSARSLEISLPANDADGDPLLISRASEPSHGKVEGTGEHVIYTPAPDFHGEDSFRYSVWDGTALSIGTVTITVLEPSLPPVIESYPDYVSGPGGSTLRLKVDYQGDFPMSFQWFKNGTPLSDGNGTLGANTNELTLTSPDSGDTGYYYLSLVNPVGVTNNSSSPIALDVYDETPAQALILHYKFDEETGTLINDSSPSGNNHGTTLSNAVWTSDGYYEGAIGSADLSGYFAGFSPENQEDLNFDPRGDSYTFSIWARTTTTSGFRSIFNKTLITPRHRQFQISTNSNPNSLEFYNGNVRGYLDTTTIGNPLTNGEWHHIAAVNGYDFESQSWLSQLYYDGDLIAEFQTGDAGKNNEPILIGKSGPWNGQMDDFRIYRKALSSQEIEELYLGTQPKSYTYSDWADATNNHGSPNAIDPFTGLSNRLLYALDITAPDNGVASMKPLLMTHYDATGAPSLHYNFRARKRADDLRVTIQTSNDLEQWMPLLIDGETALESILEADPDGDGSAVLKSVTLPLAPKDSPQFLRLTAEQR